MTYATLLWCNLRISESTNIAVWAMYRSQHGQRDSTIQLVNLLCEISAKRFSHLVIMGDLNFKEIDSDKLKTTEIEKHISSSCIPRRH